MSVFNVEIEYPIHINGRDTAVFADVMDSEVLHHLDHFKWRQYRPLQMQAIGKKATFLVSCLEQEHAMRITLLDDTESGRVELKLETNIVIYEAKKDFFGLFTRQVKDYVNFERLTVEEVRRYLTFFLLKNIDALIHEYKADHLVEMSVA